VIYNRTLDDVKIAQQIVDEKVKTFQELTQEEIDTLERGRLTINTLNRIERKQAELQSVVNNMGYYDTNVNTKNWSYSQFFDERDLKRIVDNTKSLRKAFFVLKTTPRNPVAEYHYREFNNMEKILFDIDEMTADVVKYYKYCGEFYCGG
jgi:hypothetical protein